MPCPYIQANGGRNTHNFAITQFLNHTIHMNYENTATFAAEMDAQDPLRSYRERFHLPIKKDGKPHIYLCGNSLGLQPKSTRQYIKQELLDWEKLGVEGHFHARNPWMPYHPQREFAFDDGVFLPT